MGSAEGMSVWFACKLCKSFFLNADDFAYHKKKSHVQEFRSTKFIVFEEQATPTASPPENWVSFLSPREETQIHKIISSPPPTATTNVDSCDTSSENVTTDPSEEFIEIDLKSNVFIVNNRDGGSYDDSQVSNNCFELNSKSNSIIEADKALFAVDNQEIDLLQSSIAPTSTDSDLTDKNQDKFCSSRTKATVKSIANNLERSNKKIPKFASKKALLQTVSQSPVNPYVSLKRLNLRSIQNASSSHSNNTISQENEKSDTNRSNSSAKSAKQPKVKDADQQNIIASNSTFPSSPVVAVGNCQFCSEHFNVAAELHIHEDFCRLRSQFENILCVSCLLTFASSDELIIHNHEFHFGSISNPTPVTDALKVAPKKQIQSDILPNVCNTSSLSKMPLSIKTGDHLHNIDLIPDLDLDAVSNADSNYSCTPNPNLYDDGLVEVVKTEYIADETEDCELPSEDHDPFESVSAVEVDSSVEPTLDLSSCSSNNSEGNHHKRLQLQPHSSRYFCVSCQKNLISGRDKTIHDRTHHRTQGGKVNFTCPHPNCEKTFKTRRELRVHVMQVHCIKKSFKCPQPNCGKAFKRPDNRNRHYKLHLYLNTSIREVEQVSDGLETRNIADSSSSSFNILDKKIVLSKRSSQFRYCYSCKKYFPSLNELRNHNETYHVTKEGKPFFNCPYPSCGKTLRTRDNLTKHLKLVHSKAQPFKCPHPNCKMYFKTAKERNAHFDGHTRPGLGGGLNHRL